MSCKFEKWHYRVGSHSFQPSATNRMYVVQLLLCSSCFDCSTAIAHPLGPIFIKNEQSWPLLIYSPSAPNQMAREERRYRQKGRRSSWFGKQQLHWTESAAGWLTIGTGRKMFFRFLRVSFSQQLLTRRKSAARSIKLLL